VKKRIMLLMAALGLILCACSVVGDPSSVQESGEEVQEPVTLYVVTS